MFMLVEGVEMDRESTAEVIEEAAEEDGCCCRCSDSSDADSTTDSGTDVGGVLRASAPGVSSLDEIVDAGDRIDIGSMLSGDDGPCGRLSPPPAPPRRKGRLIVGGLMLSLRGRDEKRPLLRARLPMLPIALVLVLSSPFLLLLLLPLPLLL